MNILALDTSAEYVSLAIQYNKQIESHNIKVGQKHAENILDALRSLLQSCQLTISQIDGIAYGKGPGAFSGLRIGCAIAQGLAFAHDIPLVGISTLKALALQSEGTHIISSLDARMNQIYLAMYQWTNRELITLLEPMICTTQTLPPLPESLPGTVWSAIGNGFGAQTALQQYYPLSVTRTEAFVQARDILLLALPRFHAGKTMKAENADLLYIRNKVALTIAERSGQ